MMQHIIITITAYFLEKKLRYWGHKIVTVYNGRKKVRLKKLPSRNLKLEIKFYPNVSPIVLCRENTFSLLVSRKIPQLELSEIRRNFKNGARYSIKNLITICYIYCLPVKMMTLCSTNNSKNS